MVRTRVGFGCDTHRLIPVNAGSRIVICGVAIDTSFTLDAHSDGDVGLHALVDSMLGSCALGDIGEHFPNSDSQWKEKDSRYFVAYALDLIKKSGGQISNVDITVVSQNVHLGALKMNMRIAVAEMLDLPTNDVSVKAKTAERMGALGRGEGIAAYATTLVQFMPHVI